LLHKAVVTLAAKDRENRAKNPGGSMPEKAVIKKAARRPPLKQSKV
jgi:hypothetical protein